MASSGPPVPWQRGGKNRLPPRALLCLGGLGFSTPAAAFDLWGTGPLSSSSVQVSSDLEIRYHQNDDLLPNFEDRSGVLDYFEQVERVNLLLTRESLSVGLQVDQAAFFANKYVLDGEEIIERPLYDQTQWTSPWDSALVRLEKAFVEKRWNRFELVVGDTYASFGRGIALNIVKNTNIDIDTSIRGAKLAWLGADADVTVVSGLSNTQDISQDNPNLLVTRDVPHMVTGIRGSHYALGPVQAGLHGVVYRFGREAERDIPAVGRYGGGLDALAAGADTSFTALGTDWAFEGDVFQYLVPELSGLVEGQSRLGWAGYGSATFYPGPFTVLAEAKATRDTERLMAFSTPENWEVANVPTLEYEMVITEDSAATVNSNDVIGARVRVDYAAIPAVLTPYVSFAGFRDEEVGGLHFNKSPETIGHAITGVEWVKDRKIVIVNTGYRMDVRDVAAEGADRMAHLDAEIQLPLGPEDGLEIALNGRRFWWGNNEFQQENFLEMNNAVAWHRGEKWVFLVYQDFTDNPVITSRGNIPIEVSSTSEEAPPDQYLYGAGEVIWHPNSASTLRFFYGAYKAGIRCSGGQCRSLPGFEGGRVSWQTVF